MNLIPMLGAALRPIARALFHEAVAELLRLILECAGNDPPDIPLF